MVLVYTTPDEKESGDQLERGDRHTRMREFYGVSLSWGLWNGQASAEEYRGKEQAEKDCKFKMSKQVALQHAEVARCTTLAVRIQGEIDCC